MIIESETVSRGMKSEGSRPLGGAAETEAESGNDETAAVDGSTVFIGRASFRMTPVPTDQNFGRGFDDVSPGDVAEVAAAPASPEWFVRTEDAVVLMPPASVVSVPNVANVESLAAANSVMGLETTKLPRMVVRPASAAERPPRRAGQMWMVGAALLAGATVTLSAQAVMRRPGRSDTMTTMARARLAAVTTPFRTPGTPAAASSILSVPEVLPQETEEPAALDAAAVAPRTAPVVVASTVPFPFAHTERLAAARSPRAPSRARPPRAGRFPAAGAPAALSSSRTSAGGAPVAWVDPFVGQAGATPVTAKTTAAKSTASKPVNAKAAGARTATTGRTTWVDPFAD